MSAGRSIAVLVLVGLISGCAGTTIPRSASSERDYLVILDVSSAGQPLSLFDFATALPEGVGQVRDTLRDKFDFARRQIITGSINRWGELQFSLSARGVFDQQSNVALYLYQDLEKPSVGNIRNVRQLEDVIAKQAFHIIGLIEARAGGSSMIIIEGCETASGRALVEYMKPVPSSRGLGRPVDVLTDCGIGTEEMRSRFVATLAGVDKMDRPTITAMDFADDAHASLENARSEDGYFSYHLDGAAGFRFVPSLEVLVSRSPERKLNWYTRHVVEAIETRLEQLPVNASKYDKSRALDYLWAVARGTNVDAILASDHTNTRRTAMRVAAKFEGGDKIPRLTAIALDNNEQSIEVRIEAVEQLAATGDGGAFDTLANMLRSRNENRQSLPDELTIAVLKSLRERGRGMDMPKFSKEAIELADNRYQPDEIRIQALRTAAALLAVETAQDLIEREIFLLRSAGILEDKKQSADLRIETVFAVRAFPEFDLTYRLIDIVADPNEDSSLRDTATAVIGDFLSSTELADDDYVPQFVAAIENNRDLPELKIRGVLALGRVDHPLAREALRRIATRVSHPDVKAAAMRTVAEIEGEEAAAIFVEALRDDVPVIQFVAARLLSDVGTEKEVRALEVKKALYEAERQELGGNSLDQQRDRELTALLQAVETALDNIRERSVSRQKKQFADAIAVLECTPAARGVCDAVGEDEKVLAIQQLSKMVDQQPLTAEQEKRAVAAILGLSEGLAAEMRRAATQLFGNIDLQNHISEIDAYLADANGSERYFILNAIVARQFTAPSDGLLARILRLSDDPIRSVRRRAVESLSDLGDAESFKLLVSSIAHTESDLDRRERARAALGILSRFSFYEREPIFYEYINVLVDAVDKLFPEPFSAEKYSVSRYSGRVLAAEAMYLRRQSDEMNAEAKQNNKSRATEVLREAHDQITKAMVLLVSSTVSRKLGSLGGANQHGTLVASIVNIDENGSIEDKIADTAIEAGALYYWDRQYEASKQAFQWLIDRRNRLGSTNDLHYREARARLAHLLAQVKDAEAVPAARLALASFRGSDILRSLSRSDNFRDAGAAALILGLVAKDALVVSDLEKVEFKTLEQILNSFDDYCQSNTSFPRSNQIDYPLRLVIPEACDARTEVRTKLGLGEPSQNPS